jgi:hypothetical protein
VIINEVYKYTIETLITYSKDISDVATIKTLEAFFAEGQAKRVENTQVSEREHAGTSCRLAF